MLRVTGEKREQAVNECEPALMDLFNTLQERYSMLGFLNTAKMHEYIALCTSSIDLYISDERDEESQSEYDSEAVPDMNRRTID